MSGDIKCVLCGKHSKLEWGNTIWKYDGKESGRWIVAPDNKKAICPLCSHPATKKMQKVVNDFLKLWKADAKAKEAGLS